MEITKIKSLIVSFRLYCIWGYSQRILIPFLSILFTWLSIALAFGQSQNNLEDYTNFLKIHKTQTSKQYILSLFKKYDIVVLCERNHPETSQYDLIYDIASSTYFINNVGNIFTEVGSISNRQNTLNFIKTKFSNDSIKQIKQAEVYRNGFFPQLWSNTNFYNFTGKLNSLNGTLSKSKQINLFTSGSKNPTLEQRADIEGMKQYVKENFNMRDSLMAGYIISSFDSLLRNSGRKKALVIMNYRHAFSKSLSNNGTINVGDYLKRHYGGRFANVYINGLASTLNISEWQKSKPKVWQSGDHIPILFGKWDAAFKLTQKENMGFDFHNTPFGKDSFDIWPYPTKNNYEDIFTGFVYYLPLEKHRSSNGVKNFFRGADLDQIIKEWNLFNKVLGKNEEKKSTPGFKADFERDMSTERSSAYPELKQYENVIDQWLTK